MSQRSRILLIAAAPSLLLLLFTALAPASPVTLPFTFTPGEIADANQVNANFQDLAIAVNDNDARIGWQSVASETLPADRTTFTVTGIDGRYREFRLLVLGGHGATSTGGIPELRMNGDATVANYRGGCERDSAVLSHDSDSFISVGRPAGNIGSGLTDYFGDIRITETPFGIFVSAIGSFDNGPAAWAWYSSGVLLNHSDLTRIDLSISSGGTDWGAGSRFLLLGRE